MSHSRPRRLVAWVLTVVAAFAVGMLVSWMLWSFSMGRNGGNGDGNGNGNGNADRPTESFAISGDLSEPFLPGVSVPLDVSITNTHDHALTVSELKVTVQSVEAPNATPSRPCDTDDFIVEQISAAPTLLVDAGMTSSLADLGVAPEEWPQVGMADAASNQDGCKGASLGLAYTAMGRYES